jgi:2-polyprenyl-3-methyl-5-hydroxy-6-metoxy-1,4-benzoquinol methylase
MRAARTGGWTVVGTEVAQGAAEAVRSEGFDVHLGELAEVDLDEESFDVISLVEVLEHVNDPAGLIHDAKRLLRPGGAVYVTTPHGRGISARVLGDRWSAVAPPEHLQIFSVRGLETALARAG